MSGNSDTERREKIWTGQPIEHPCGLTFHPFTMRQYEDWTFLKRSLILRQSTMPGKYAVMPYLSAIYAMDYDCRFQIGIFRGTIELLARASLLSPKDFQFRMQADAPDKLISITYKDETHDVTITPADYPTIRALLAEQNGEKLPDEADNPELVQAEMDIAAMHSGNLQYDFETMIDSMAYQLRKPKRDILDMTVREFTRTRQAIDRDKLYMLLAAAEYGGMVKFNKGNPQPSWMLDVSKEPTSLEKMTDFVSRTGIQNA